METKTVTREDLYEEVWTTPITRLAAKYHLSDVGFSKVCKKLNIPKPPRGYWAKVNAGVKMKKQPLPPLKKDTPPSHVFYLREKASNKYAEALAEADAFIESLEVLKKPIIVSDRLSSMHPHVRVAYDLLKTMAPDNYGVLQLKKKGYLNIRVGPKSLKRAMRILNALLKAFDSLGFKVQSCQSGYGTTCILMNGEEVPFILDERTTYTGYEPTAAERRKNRSRYRWDYEPTGFMSFRIETWGYDGLQKQWSDTNRKTLEERINSFITGAIRVAFIERQDRLEREERDRRYAVEQRRRAEERRRYEEELRKCKDFESQASSWSRSRELRLYIQAVRDKALQDNLDEDTYSTLQEWLCWARGYADTLDPLKRLPLNDILEHRDSNEK